MQFDEMFFFFVHRTYIINIDEVHLNEIEQQFFFLLFCFFFSRNNKIIAQLDNPLIVCARKLIFFEKKRFNNKKKETCTRECTEYIYRVIRYNNKYIVQ